jgi:hypothetical protein
MTLRAGMAVQLSARAPTKEPALPKTKPRSR